jgi:hypothetical protein|nr:MAG TPA_asm: hypothetical protein [Caudoviricetes sp.]
MAFEIVDGMTGTKHISSDDLAALNTATVGRADCVLEYGDDFELTMQSANSATLGTGVGMVGGKRFWNQAATGLTIQSGTQGQKRNDLVVARYAKTSAGIESITPVVIKGTPTTGTAADPKVTANDLKLWRVPLNGINAGTPVRLFDPVASLATLGDSVSRMKIASGRANIYGCDATLDVSYIPAIHSLVFETKGSGYMTTGTQTGYSAKVLTLPSNYLPTNERIVCICANMQLKFGVALRVQTNGDAMFDVSSSEPMRGFGWPSAMGFIPL